MKSLVVSVIAVGLLAPAAHAGTYVSAGVGNGAWTDGSLAGFSTDGQHSGRAMIGQRFPFVSIEGGFNYFGLSAKVPWSAYSAVADVKLDLPLIPLLSVYLKGGLEHTWVLPAQGASKSFGGNGWVGAIGVEYRLDALIANTSVWLDYSRHDDSFPDFNPRVVGTANMVTIGVSVGI